MALWLYGATLMCDSSYTLVICLVLSYYYPAEEVPSLVNRGGDKPRPRGFYQETMAHLIIQTIAQAGDLIVRHNTATSQISVDRQRVREKERQRRNDCTTKAL